VVAVPFLIIDLWPGATPAGVAAVQMTIRPYNVAGATIAIPIAPVEAEWQDLGMDYAVVARPRRVDALIGAKPKLAKWNCTLDVVGDIADTAFNTVAALEKYANWGIALVVSYSPGESGLWRITDMSYRVIDRMVAHNTPNRYEVDIEFTRVSDINSNSPASPITGGIQAMSAVPNIAGYVYDVKSGDTLWDISIKVYGTGDRWRELARKNRIIDPRNLADGLPLRLV
jgi:nucleoid-associated protein YgaU